MVKLIQKIFKSVEKQELKSLRLVNQPRQLFPIEVTHIKLTSMNVPSGFIIKPKIHVFPDLEVR